jgi:hypothetical protein
MWYLGSLFVLVIFLLSCAYVGGAVCRLLPWRIRPHATVAFGPALGLAVFVLLATAVGWLGVGFRPWICLSFTAGLVALSVWADYNPAMLRRTAGRIAGFCVVSSVGWFFSVIRFGAFDPFSDAFTYLAHAQWLQANAFRTPAIASGQYPAFTQIAFYQALGGRMGASFLFGWVQATFGIDWSYLVYPAVVLLPLVASSIAIAGMAFFVVRKGRIICLLGGIAVGTTLNGTSFGALFGFLPQTYGIAFAFSFLSLLGMYLSYLRRGIQLRLWNVVPSSLLLAALLYSYPEISPFVLLSAFACLAVLCLSQTLVRSAVDFGVKLLLLVALLVNHEVFRIWNSIRLQKGAVLGGPISWAPIHFLAHAAGFLSGAWDGGYGTLGTALGSEVAAVLFISASIAALAVFRQRIIGSSLMPIAWMLGITLFGFLYFRYASSSPWSEGVGQSWNQFKLSQWISIFVLLILACGSALASTGPRWARFATFGILLVWQSTGLFWNYVLADSRTAQVRQETGFSQAPFDAFIQLRQEAKFAGNEPIFLDLGGPHVRTRQLVSYFLEDRPVASDWSDDSYVLGSLSPSQRTLALQPSMWIVSEANSALPKPGEQRIGRLSFKRATDKEITLVGVSGGFGEETDGSSSWYWTGHSLRYQYKVAGGKPVHLRGRFTYLPAPNDRALRISIVSGDTRPLQQLEMQRAWTPLITQPFDIIGPEFGVEFDCPQPPVHLSSADPRMMSFLIKDLVIEVIE